MKLILILQQGMVFGFIDSSAFFVDAILSFAAGYIIENAGWNWFWMSLTILSTIATFFFGIFMVVDLVVDQSHTNQSKEEIKEK
jgi:sugar phosphate permease